MNCVLAYLSFVSTCVCFATDYTTVSHVAAICMLDGAIPLIYFCIIRVGCHQPDVSNHIFIVLYRISGYFGCVKFWLFWAKTGGKEIMAHINFGSPRV